MGSTDGGLVEGNPFPSAFALFLIQVIFIICLSRLLAILLRPVSEVYWENNRTDTNGSLPHKLYDIG